MRAALKVLFVLYVAGNMALCALLFFLWAEPRETVSGLMGRWEETETGWKHRVGAFCSKLIDIIYFWEPDHCREVYLCEEAARQVLYK